eukprot:TRINITY_DN122_c1_g2_i1.p1 TRINITY_DN122_c1_g2~~TRINITY_DN122_c1_g2_i1.p1  ORF type:complete len:667 (-),score=27.51 TRINITY_DN122_c1_g2_i1:348-2348(-)
MIAIVAYLLLLLQPTLTQESSNCTVSLSNCLQCARVLVLWQSHKRLVYLQNQQASQIRTNLQCIFPEATFDVNGTVLELWDNELEEFYEIGDTTFLETNSKVNIKEHHHPFPPNIQSPKLSHTHSEMLLRKELLENYDVSLWPWIDIHKECIVYVHISFQRMLDIDLSHGIISMQVWFRLRWNDPRFTWDPEYWGGVQYIYLDKGEFWDPQIEIWNGEDSIYRELEDQQAYVNSTGDIFWSRGGQIKLQCDMQGLNHFPYDSSQCKIQLGSWVHNNEFVKLLYYREGYDIYQSKTSDRYYKYSQYKIQNVSVQQVNYSVRFFDTLLQQNNAPWAVIMYNITFSRHHLQYTMSIVVPQGLLVFVSFMALWLPPSSGERIGFTVTIALAISVYKLLMYQLLPASALLVYIASFSFSTFIFTTLVVIESAIVVMLWFRTDPYLFSPWQSFKSAAMDLREASAWMDVIKALNIEVTKNRVEIHKMQWKIKLISWMSGSWDSIMSSLSKARNRFKQDPVLNKNESPNSVVQMSASSMENGNTPVIYAVEENGNHHNVKPVGRNQSSIFKNINDIEKAQQFLRYTFEQPQHKKANLSYERLIKYYPEQKVQQSLFRLLGIVEEDEIELLNEQSDQKYNKKWRKLSNMIDRVCQYTFIPAFILFVVISTYQVA